MFKKLLWILFIIILLFGAGLSGVYFWYRSGGLQTAVVKQLDEKVKQSLVGNNTATTTVEPNVLQEILGFNSPKTYLLLFLNNTELRPGGGFIGVYAVVRVDKGKPEILKVEGSEILDNYAPRDFVSTPPAPLAKYIASQRWEFRDSNWWPDFASSSAKTLELYKKENGLSADKIDAVIGFTPTVIEEALKIIGPIKYQGEEFNSKNFTAKLEYEVEYGYKDKGLSFNNRKDILDGLTKTLVKHLAIDIFLHWSDYTKLTERMIKEKHLMAFTTDGSAQSIIESKNLAGKVKNVTGDYILWVDANLGAWKTDASLKRELSYSFVSVGSGKYLATLKMKYIHQGWFDWRTSRYRTYTRVYLPLDSEFVGVKGSLERDRSAIPGKVDQGLEHNKKWFGTFTAVEPQTTGELVWQFYLSPSVVKQIEAGAYTLFVQKQLGTIDHSLTLGLNFGKSIVYASPGEPTIKHGDTIYDYSTDLREDREFQVKFR